MFAADVSPTAIASPAAPPAAYADHLTVSVGDAVQALKAGKGGKGKGGGKGGKGGGKGGKCGKGGVKKKC